MKKIFLLTAVLTVSLLTSCLKDSGTSSYRVWMLKSMESKYVGKPAIKTEYSYSDSADPSSTSQTIFKGLPVVSLQEITGDTISKITYNYYHKSASFPRNVITCHRYLTDGSVITDSLEVNNQGMAAVVLQADGTTTPYYITYRPNNGGRQMVGNYNLEVEDGNYSRATREGGIIVTDYKYSNFQNLIGLQQLGIYGSPYYWATDTFGLQNRSLLSRVIVYNNGEGTDTYEFTYMFDLWGFVSKEVITLNDEAFMTNTYTYVMGSIFS